MKHQRSCVRWVVITETRRKREYPLRLNADTLTACCTERLFKCVPQRSPNCDFPNNAIGLFVYGQGSSIANFPSPFAKPLPAPKYPSAMDSPTDESVANAKHKSASRIRSRRQDHKLCRENMAEFIQDSREDDADPNGWVRHTRHHHDHPYHIVSRVQ